MRRECRERFPRHRFQRKPIVSDPGIHHGTCVTHVPWCISGSLIRSGGEKRSRHSWRMRNPQFSVSGKRHMWVKCSLVLGMRAICSTLVPLSWHESISPNMRLWKWKFSSFCPVNEMHPWLCESNASLLVSWLRWDAAQHRLWVCGVIVYLS